MIDLDRLRTARAFGAKLWVLIRPYWRSEERWHARRLLAALAGFNLGIVYLAVRFNQWNREFFNALERKDYATFRLQLWYFTGLALIYIAIAVYQLYLQQMLEIRWRRWLTHRYWRSWLADEAYYLMQLKDYGTDNPEQRIQEDIRILTDSTLSLSLGLLSAAARLVSFLVILWGLSGALNIQVLSVAVRIPAYMVWVAVVYALAGSLGAHKIGGPLALINFNQQRFEADFRYRMTRIRDNSESIALYRGERNEEDGLDGSFASVWANWWRLMKRQKNLTWFTASYGQLAVIFPFVVAAPQYFSGAVPLGGLVQTAGAFGHVQNSLSWFVDNYTRFAEWKATVDRLITFGEALHLAADDPARRDGIRVEANTAPALEVRGLELTLPTGRVLLRGVNERIDAGEAVLITGPSGSGKTTFFRALAGIWPFGQGTVRTPQGAKVLFLPQRPYLSLGTLKQATCYPSPTDNIPDATVIEVLQACRLGHMKERLLESANWSLVMSPGEQQRLGFARILINRPNWVFLDEATSAVDEETEHHLYELIRERLRGSTILSIVHRNTVSAFHHRRLHIEPQELIIASSPLP